MIATIEKTITLEEFLQQPETKPPQEFINGVITPKPMPQGEHSRLQIKLSTAIRHLQNIIITKNWYNLINFQTEGDRL